MVMAITGTVSETRDLRKSKAPHVVLNCSHSMKNGLKIRQSQMTSVLSSIIAWELCWT